MYRQNAPPSWASDVVDAVWSVSFNFDVDDWLVLPDGAIDIVLVPGGSPSVAGPATRASSFGFSAGSKAVGIRMMAGAAPALLGVASDDLVDSLVPFSDIGLRPWPDDIPRAQEAIDRGDIGEAMSRLTEVLSQLKREVRPDQLVMRAAALLRLEPNLNMPDLAQRLSLSERQLRRRFTANVGLGPKRFARTMRLQRMLELERNHAGASLSRLSLEAGYFDQAHMVNEFLRLSGRTPKTLLRLREETLGPATAVRQT